MSIALEISPFLGRGEGEELRAMDVLRDCFETEQQRITLIDIVRAVILLMTSVKIPAETASAAIMGKNQKED